MLILLSPAKRLNLENPVLFNTENQPFFARESDIINAALAKLKPKQLAEMQHISEALALENYERNQQRVHQKDLSYYRAIHLFNGDAYVGLNAKSLSEEAIKFAQNHLRILSGLYGWLKPLDNISPYRLEMGSKLKAGRAKNLYQFWQNKITAHIATEFGEAPIVNLASAEYSKVINFSKLKNEVVNITFKNRNAAGQYRVMSFYAKKARGSMARFILQNKIVDISQLVHFQGDGYMYSDLDSTPSNLVFLHD